MLIGYAPPLTFKGLTNETIVNNGLRLYLGETMIHSFTVWGDSEDILFLKDARKFETFQDALNAQVLPAQNDGEWFDSTLAFLWELRRLFWIELIPTGRIRVKFMHHGETGAGVGPQTLLRSRSQDNLGSDLTLWPEEESFVLQPEWFDRSDQLYMECMNESLLFDWPELELVNIASIDHDNELFEHSFSSADIVQLTNVAVAPCWAEIGPSGQRSLVLMLSGLINSQFQEFEEIIFDPRDLLALVAAHPGTNQEVLKLEVFENQEALLKLAR